MPRTKKQKEGIPEKIFVLSVFGFFPGESGAGAASAGDVSFCVLKAVLGQEMTHTVWSAGEALSTLASWEEGALEHLGLGTWVKGDAHVLTS